MARKSTNLNDEIVTSTTVTTYDASDTLRSGADTGNLLVDDNDMDNNLRSGASTGNLLVDDNDMENNNRQFLTDAGYTDMEVSSGSAPVILAADAPIADNVDDARADIDHTRADLEQTLEAIKEKLNPQVLMASAKETISEVTTHAVESAKDSAKDAVGDVVHKAQDAVGDVVHKAQDTVAPVVAAVSGAFEKAKDAVGDAVHSAQDVATPALQNTQATVGNALHTTQQGLGTAANAVKDTGTTALNWVKTHPLPAALAGLGIGWLAYEIQSRRSRAAIDRYALTTYDSTTPSSYNNEYPVANQSIYGARPLGYDGPAAGSAGYYATTSSAGITNPDIVVVNESNMNIPQNTNETNLLDSGKQAAQNIAGQVQNAAGQAASSIGDAASVAKDKAVEAASAVAGTTQNAASTVATAITSNPIPVALTALSIGYWVYSSLTQNKPATNVTDRLSMDPSLGETGYGVERVIYNTGDYTTLYGDASSDSLYDSRNPLSSAASNVSSGVSSAANSVSTGVSSAANTVSTGVASAANTVSTGISSAANSVSANVSSATATAKDALAGTGEKAQQAWQSTQQAVQTAATQVQQSATENPFVLGAVALAVGAALGLLVPESAIEHKAMGETRDKLVGMAQHQTDELKTKAQIVVEEAVGAAKQAFEDISTTAKQAGQEVISTVQHKVEDQGLTMPKAA